VSHYPPPPPHVPFAQPPIAGAPAPSRTSGAAIASLICSILGLCTIGLTGIVGIILGVIAIRSIGASRGAVGGKGLAISGIVIGAISIATSCLQIGILLPAIGKARHTAREVMQITHANSLGQAAMIHVFDHDRYPSADGWVNDLVASVGDPAIVADLISSPFEDSGSRTVAINSAVAGRATAELSAPSETVLFFECATNGPLAGGHELLPSKPRASRGFVVIYADGRAVYLAPNEVDALRWSL
jgi:hypothetical protein